MSVKRGGDARADASWCGDVGGAPLARLAALFSWRPVTLLLWVLAISSLAAVAVHLPERVGKIDFSNYYASAWTMRSGGNPYVADLNANANRLGFNLGPLKFSTQTPAFVLYFEPLTLLKPRVAYWIWQLLNLVALCVSMFLLLMRRDRMQWTAVALAPLLLLYPPVADVFAYAQSQLQLLMILVLMLFCLERGWDAGAGLLLALAGLLRAFPLAIAGYFVLRRRWTVCLWLGIGLAVGAAFTWAMIGPRCADFLKATPWGNSYLFLALPVMVSVVAVVSRIFWYSFGPTLPPALETLRLMVGAGAVLTVLAFTLRATLIMDKRRDSDWRLLSLWIATAIMISPNAQLHYLVLLFIPFAALCSAGLSGAASNRALTTGSASYALSFFTCAGLSCITVLNSPAVQGVARGPIWKVLGPGAWLILAKEECAFVALLLAYLATYWFVIDSPNARDALTDHRIQVAPRLSASSAVGAR